MKTMHLIFIILMIMTFRSFSQDIPDKIKENQSKWLRVFLDCDYCDFDYFRTNFTGVDYVNDQEDADVHVMVSELTNGSGGSEYTMIFKGRNRFAAHVDTLKCSLPGTSTDDEIREVLLENFQLGLVPYIIKTPARKRISLFFDDSPVESEVKDPWKNWMFELSGGGSFYSQKSSSDLTLNGSVYISKVTPEIKFESSNDIYYYDSRLKLYDQDTLLYSLRITQRSYSSSNLFVKSLGEHLGLGGYAVYNKSDYSNLSFQTVTGPAIELNLFKYSDASRKQFRFNYALLFEHSVYNDTTINNKLEDDLFAHSLNITFTYLESWGTINATINATGYLNDMNKFSVGTYNTAYIRLSKGLSLNFSFGLSYSQNQIYLAKDMVTMEEFLTGQKEMERSLSYNFGIGLSYRFGSIFNNSVNPRFGY